MMRKWTIIVLLLWLGCFSTAPLTTIRAETGQTNRELLQKGLTVYEIDQELTRIADQQTKLSSQLGNTEQLLQSAVLASTDARQHAAKVVRAYYMGNRDSLWTLLFNIRSLSDALSMFEYLQMILRTDRLALKRHEDASLQLKALQTEQREAQASLQQSKERYVTEKTRLASMQKEVDELLAQNTEAAKIQRQMAELNRLWQDKGIPLFKTYFQALAQAMKQLPELVTAGSGSGGTAKSTHLIMNGFNYTFQMTDKELNTFLQQKNERFRNMQFRFANDLVITSGKQEDIALTIKGTYQMASKEEGKAKSYIRYTIQELQFNGYTLPASTIDALQKDFDLGIYPQNFASFLQVTGLTLEEGKLSIFFKLAL